MIKFFRQIRRNLLSENKTGKYLKYAIGEIVLVVVGILIALQLNNWNESRKLKAIEIEIYKEIKNDIFESSEDLKSGLNNHIENLQEAEFLRDHILNKKEYIDSIIFPFMTLDDDDQFFPKSTGFDALKSLGLKTLSNDSLRKEISDLFQLKYKRIVDMGREETQSRGFRHFRTYIREYLRVGNEMVSKLSVTPTDSIQVLKRKIINYHEFLKDDELLSEIHSSLFIRRFKIIRYNQTLEDGNNVLIAIDKELERLAH